jgi:hypothetical protein
MLKLLSALIVALFVLAAAPSVQAAPAAGLLSLKNTQSVIEPVYWRHRHWHHYRYWRHRHYRYWRHPVYWRHRHYRYWRHPVYWRHHRRWRYYRYWRPARRHCGWWR